MKMIEFSEAIEIVLKSVIPTGSETVSFADSPGRVLAKDIFSDINMPPFNKATVDGFACHSEELGSDMEIVETIAAGRIPIISPASGQCSRIMTGAAVPPGCDIVFMVEHSLIQASGKVKFTGTSSKDNISPLGEDIKTGDCVIKRGRLLKIQDVPVLASVGCTLVEVKKMPVISVISTGSELVEPEEKPGIAQIRNSNGWQLLSQIKRAGAMGRYMGIAHDDKEETFNIIEKALSESDIVILTGGVSMGDFDFVPSVLEKAGVNILFSRVNVQPGKPTTFGIHPKALVFGLPGNPVSAFVQFELLVRPLIYRMMDCSWKPLTFPLRMKESYSRRSPDRQAFIPVSITDDGMVLPVEYHGSAHISSLVDADGIIAVPSGIKSIEKGEMVDVRQI